jgi:glycosyltransferase involved in cell wall biosynthesis
MRILMIAPPWFAVPPAGYGGIEQVVAVLADGLVDAGHEVTLLASGGSRTRAELLTTYDRPPSSELGNPAVELAHVLVGYRQRARFDVVHDHTLTGAALGGMPGGPPVVHTLHGPWTASITELYRQLSDRLHLVAISHDQAARTPPGIALAGVVHNGIDLQGFRFDPDGGPDLAFIGRANPEKGPVLAIEAARRLGRRIVMSIKVNELAERDYFDDVIAPALDGTDVELRPVDSHHAKVELLGKAQAVLFPICWAEPFGLVPLEANACGTPVVAFAEGAVAEVVADRRSGFLVPPGDLDALCAAVERIDELSREECRAVASERFDAQHMVAGYLEIYERAIAGRPR